MATKLRDLRRTELALEAYDKDDAEFKELNFTELSDEDAKTRIAHAEYLCGLVGENYGLDTADINNIQDCKRACRQGSSMLKFIRRMVKDGLEIEV